MSMRNIRRVADEVLDDLLDDPADTGQGRRDAMRTMAALDRDDLVELVLNFGRRLVRLELEP